jgi:hypothetical protein
MHGTCAVANGVAGCTCAPGYVGLQCAGCAPGFLFVPDERDGGAPPAAADAGPAGDAGFTPLTIDGGPIPGTCVQAQVCTRTACPPFWDCDDSSGVVACSCNNANCSSCSMATCSGHGTCDDSSGVATCVSCDPGYAGPTCSDCHLGYEPADGGMCVFEQICQPQTCSGGGTCSSASGMPVCTCLTGYTGQFCESCATGFVRSASSGGCEAAQTCAPDSCSATEVCDDSTGSIVCACQPGYAGPGCTLCYPGYHQEPVDGGMGTTLGVGIVCALDQQCTATSCGTGVCDDGTGIVTCSSCAPGWSGSHCEVGQNACGTDCNTGACINLQSSYVCLCTDGTWGQSCLPGPTLSDITPSSGSLLGGATITLTGTLFDSGATVSIGGVAATQVRFVSATELDVVAPPGMTAGPATVVVTDSNAQTAQGAFTYTPVVFSSTGANQTFTVPGNVTSLHVQVWGAGGGAGQDPASVGGAGGFGEADLTVTPGAVFTVVAGSGGAQVTMPEMLDGGVDAGPGTAAGAGGGYSGIFLNTSVVAGNAILIAGGGGGAGFGSGANGGNGGGAFGAAGSPVDSGAGLGGNNAAGGIGGCLQQMQCGGNGSQLQGGAGGIPSVATPLVAASYGGGGAVGNGPGFNSAGGGGGYFGGGGAAGGGGGGGGGGTGFASNAVSNSDLESSPVQGAPLHTTDPGYVSGVGAGGSAQSPNGGDGLVLVSW